MCASQVIPSVGRTLGCEAMFRLVILLVLIGPFQGSPKGMFPPDERWVLVVPGATDVTREQGPAWLSIMYRVKEPYPARSVISHVLEFMSRDGWTLISKGWTDTEPSEHSIFKMRHTWSAVWRDDAAEFDVSYRLVYTCKFEHLGLHSAWATVTTGVVNRAEYEAYRKSVRRKPRNSTVQGGDELQE
jgi:hypothetical protein